MTNTIIASMLALSLGLIIISILIAIPFILFYLIGMWKLFEKAGKNGWEILVPIYNEYIMCEIVGLSPYWFLAVQANTIGWILGVNEGVKSLLSIINLLGFIGIIYNMAKKLHKETGWTILAVLFSFIVLPISGFNSDVWDKDAQVNKNAYFG